MKEYTITLDIAIKGKNQDEVMVKLNKAIGKKFEYWIGDINEEAKD
jgi:hypothetical protein